MRGGHPWEWLLLIPGKGKGKTPEHGWEQGRELGQSRNRDLG